VVSLTLCGLTPSLGNAVLVAALQRLMCFALIMPAVLTASSPGQAKSVATPALVKNGPLTIIGGQGISTINPDGSLRTLFHCSSRRGCHLLQSVDWAPDGRRFVFSVTTLASISTYNGIHVFNAATRTDKHIPGDGFDLDWSPNGKRIAYVEYRLGSSRPFGTIYVINADGSHRTLIHTGTTGADYSPSWSPRGNRIAFGTRRNGRASISLIALPGLHRKLLVASGSAPAWSPAGGKIAYRSPCGIKLVTPAGKDVTPVGTRRCIAIGVAGKPVWSPDGKKIAIQTSRGIYTMNADGSQVAPLTRETGRGTLGVGHPTWRPLHCC
jgi:Tol biopolymer transport system component